MKYEGLKPYVCGGWCREKEAYPKDKVDEAIAELKMKIDKAIAERDGNQVCIDALKAEIKRKEGVGQRWFERCMVERTENVRLKRALWLARANNAINSYDKWYLFANFESEDKLFTIDEYDEMPGVTDFKTRRTYAEWCKVWQNVGRKCLAKAEKYK